MAYFTAFEPQPQPAELPARLPDPFVDTPHPLARRAAGTLMDQLRRGALVGADLAKLEERHGGKMFGVLVAATPDGTVGSLCAFSGTLGGRWLVEGFAPPLFDAAVRDAFWPAGEAELRALAARLRELERGQLAPLRARTTTHAAAVRAERAALRVEQDARRRRRHALRAELERSSLADAARQHALAALAEESRAETVARGALAAASRGELERLAAELEVLDARRRDLRRRSVERSRELLARLLSLYEIPNARGERRTLPELFAPVPPPGGAADCAAPKLLALAYRLGLRPVALAEFWWGAVPVAGDRQPGAYYPACRDKCGEILPFMLSGLV